MTPKQRMLAAYRGEAADRVPVAPEFWSYVPARVLGVDMIAFERDVPLWEALRQTFRHYACDGWGAIWLNVPTPDCRTRVSCIRLDATTLESTATIETPHGKLTQRRRYAHDEPSSPTERPIKDFDRDWPAYEHFVLGGVLDEADWHSVGRALDAVGETYLLELGLPGQFFDFIAQPREGGLEQAIFDLQDHEAVFEALHERYIDYAVRFVDAACRHTRAESLFIGCQWSCVSLIGPDLWRRWDLPVVQAMSAAAHRRGRLVHMHFHGRCMDVIDDLALAGVDCICPFERPPGGDVTDLGLVRRRLGDRVTVNGNVHTVETLIRGTPDDVRAEVTSIFEQWGSDRRRLILGTGDQVGRETPDENIQAMLEAGRKLGAVRAC